MKNLREILISAVIALIVVIVDIYLIAKGGAEVPAFEREFLYQHFSGSVLDWIGAILFNLFWLGLAAALFTKTETSSNFTFGKGLGLLVIGISGLVLIILT